jgi:serine/threonine protein kinase
MALQVATAIETLHNAQPHPIVHGDLKCGNVLLEDDGLGAVVSDFGLARAVRELVMPGGISGTGGTSMVSGVSAVSSMSSGAFTLTISPPEVLRNPREARAPSADVYAFAIVLLEMMQGRLAYAGMTPSQVASVVLGGQRPPLPPNLHPSISALIQDCWAQASAARPTFTSVVARLQEVVNELAAQETTTTTTMYHHGSTRY